MTDLRLRCRHCKNKRVAHSPNGHCPNLAVFQSATAREQLAWLKTTFEPLVSRSCPESSVLAWGEHLSNEKKEGR